MDDEGLSCREIVGQLHLPKGGVNQAFYIGKFLVQFRNLLLEFHWDFKAMTGHLETKVCMDNFDLNICCIIVGYMLICFGFFFGPLFFK